MRLSLKPLDDSEDRGTPFSMNRSSKGRGNATLAEVFMPNIKAILNSVERMTPAEKDAVFEVLGKMPECGYDSGLYVGDIKAGLKRREKKAKRERNEALSSAAQQRSEAFE